MEKTILDDLARSGLKIADARSMRVQMYDADTVEKITKHFRADAYKLPYFETNGKVNGFYRLRFIEPVIDAKKGKELRYWQPPNTAPHLYFPPCIDWDAVLKDKSIPIFITEGEKKAYAAARLLKQPWIGLGGIFSWKSRVLREALIEGLIELVKDRKIIVCFDVDEAPNPDVAAARHQLARIVRQYGGECHTLALPYPDEGGKSGIDDVLVAKGINFVRALKIEPLGDELALQQLNSELSYLEDIGGVYHIPTQSMHSLMKNLVQVVYADRIIVTYDTRGNPVEKNAASEWIKWPHRRKHKNVDYMPGGPAILPGNTLNVWPGWGVPSKRGDASLFLKLIEHTFAGAEKAHKQWFMQWLAYPLQHPGAKLYTTAVMFSELQGVGKSLIGHTMGRIYGKNFVSLNAEMLHASFNDWARNKQFVLADEITGRDKKEDIERLKLLMVQEHITINAKFQQPYRLPDRSNYLLTTNHADALNIPAYDRRFFIHEIKEKTLPEAWFTRTYDPWYKSDDGAGAIFDHLLKRVDLTGFDPRARAPETDAKEEMRSLSNTDLDYKIRELLDNPDRLSLGALRVRDLYTLQELAAAIAPLGEVSHIALAKALRRCGPRPYHTRIAKGVVKLYAVRNQVKWSKSDHRERVMHYDGQAPKKEK